MEQRGTAGANADGTDMGATTEFEPDVVNLLVLSVRRAVKRELSVVGTDTVLGELVLGDTDAGEAIAPGMRKAGSLSGLISGRAGVDWVSDDEGVAVQPGEATAAEDGAGADRHEVDAVWREAVWRFGLAARGGAPEGGRKLPGMSSALRACLLSALKAARAEGTVAVRCRHVARALLEVPDSRAREALTLERLDTTAAASALDRLDAAARAGTDRPESQGVTMLRKAGVVGKSGNRVTRGLYSWLMGSTANGSPMVFAVYLEAARQAIRCGRAEVEPVDLLLGILALDRALAVAGSPLPPDLAGVNSAAQLLRRHGVRQDSLVSSASVSSDSALPSGSGSDEVPRSAAAERVRTVAQLSAAEHGSPTVGTVHLLSALLDESAAGTDAGDGGAVVRLLAAHQVDVAALRADLGLRPVG
ncbi:Clp protease N-terminal domain-containing protein [Streptomyces cavernae]|uniref:Clp protease N-terminal domain-containing protein n=1 Tax=Streptomyces cavernae TaxID=2259034 RepID=UPI000FEB764E|nr:Clp protease N-terminal domain-containing protein [Streptomyces cavernae]